jgi:hypothetical protein
LSVFGASRNSGGGMTARKEHHGKIEDQIFLPKNIGENWNKYIPKIWSEKTIYAQTVLEVLNKFNSTLQFNFPTFYGTILVYEPYLYKYIFPSIFKYGRSNLLIYVMVIYAYGIKMIGLIYRKFKFVTKNAEYEVSIANNVEEVMQKLKEFNKNLLNLK